MAMADTVVVINKGRIQQRGPPEKVYNEPRNVFVAGFIGSPPANIFTASMDYTEAPCINLPGGTRYCLDHSYSTFFNKSRVDRVIVGFRPEHAVISEHPVDGKVIIVGEVYTVEPLGRENIVTVASEEVLMKVITPPEVRPSIGDLVYVAIDEDKIMLFDPETEINIKYLVDGREGEDA